MPDSPTELVQALLKLLEAQHLCLDEENLEGVLRLADLRDHIQAQILELDLVPEDLHAPLRQAAQEGDRLIERMSRMSSHWQAQEAQDTQQARGLQQYVQEAQAPSEARFLDRLK